MHHPIHRALVTYSSSATGEIRVKIPSLLGVNSEVSISYIGREAVNGFWTVPAINNQIVVTADDENLTNLFWLQTDSYVPQHPTGSITAFAGSSAPISWLLCYGQTLVRATYPDLFAVVGTTYNTGGEAGTDFRLPDLRGRTVAGVDNMGGTDAGRLDIANSSGTVVGSQYVTLTSAQSGVPAHSHPNSASFTGTAANHNHTQDAHNHTQNSHNHTQDAHSHGYQINITLSDGEIVTAEYLTTGLGFGTVRRRYTDGTGAATATNQGITATNQSTTSTNQSTSITPAGAVTMSNQPNTAANAVSATNIMQPTMTINYIILAGV
jgi:microcystin-dependent protein